MDDQSLTLQKTAVKAAPVGRQIEPSFLASLEFDMIRYYQTM